jgi:hypothetical protein
MFFEMLFNKFNRFYERSFYKYGLFVSKHPIKIVFISIFVNVLLAFGVLRMKMITDTDDLFMTINSEAKRNEKSFANIFGTSQTVQKEFYVHQIFDLGTGAEINFRVKDDPNANILEKKYFDEISVIHKRILEHSVFTIDNTSISYENVCVTRRSKCWIEGRSLLKWDTFFEYLQENSLKLKQDIKNDAVESNVQDNIYIDGNGQMNFLGLILGKKFKFTIDDKDPLLNVGSNQTYAYARIFKIRYQMKYNVASLDIKGRLWEKEFLKVIKNTSSEILSFTYTTSKSLEDELESNIGFDSKLTTITFMLIMIFATIFMSMNTNMITSPGM